jgi:hypothetical protein
MSKHSKHGRGKFKRMQKMRQMQPSSGILQQPSAGVVPPTSGNMPIAASPVVAPPIQQTPMQRKAAAAGAVPLHYEFISGDLKRIGILTGIILVILIVLYIFLK